MKVIMLTPKHGIDIKVLEKILVEAPSLRQLVNIEIVDADMEETT